MSDVPCATLIQPLSHRPTASIPFQANHFVLLSEHDSATAQPDSDNSQHQQQTITTDELPDSRQQQDATTVTLQPVCD